MSEKDRSRVSDPVCRMQIWPEKAAGTIVYEGRAYYFCTEACRRQFEVEPDRYVRSSKAE